MRTVFLTFTLFTISSFLAFGIQSIPAHIEAEDYATAFGATVSATSDESGGQEVSWMQDSTWMTYPITVSTAGYYKVSFRVANGFSDDARLQLFADSTLLTDLIVPRTGGMISWKTVPQLIYIPSGTIQLKFLAVKGVFSLNWMKFERTLHALPGLIQAENFDVAEGVQTESTLDTDGGLNVSHIDDNDWMMYNVDVTQAGTYQFDFRVANAYGYGYIQILDQNNQFLGQTAEIPHTGGWQSWTTVTAVAALPAGNQLIKLLAPRGAFNLNWFEVSASAQTKQPAVITFSELPPRVAGEGPFALIASSNHTETELFFTTSDSTVVKVEESSQGWVAIPLKAGQATLTAHQEGNANYQDADPVARIQVVTMPSVTPMQKIPIDPNRWYVLNNAENGLQGLFDGITNQNVHVGWGMVVDQYDAYYPLLEGEEMMVEAIKMFDYEGVFTSNPATLSVITEDWQRIPIATFTGQVYNGWVGPYPDRQMEGEGQFRLDSVISGIRYLVFNIQGGLPTEIEFYGFYDNSQVDTTVTVAAREVKLKDMLGVNAYEWNFQDGETPWVINESKVEMVKSFTAIRHYMDWEKLESIEGVYSYNPTLVGGWHYDQIYERCQAEGIEVLACLKTIPSWMMATYPPGEQDAENVPVRYGKDFEDPNSYIEQAKVAFQFAARYGSNTEVDTSLLSVHSTPRWPGDNPNTIRIGTGLVKYIECDNERDKWWKGRKAYQTAREYAANLSAFYDGHKSSMGPGVGVKNADPQMQVVIGGLVSGPEYIRGMVDWCREFRGYKPDGSVDLCWDVINYHIYTDNTTSSQSGTSTRGAAPEVTNAAEKTRDFIRVSDELCGGMPVWITETGFDIHQDSPLKAVPIGTKSALDTQADWILRMSLFSARHGVAKVFYYQMYDDHDSGMIFATSGLINSNLTRRPAADFLYQTKNLFGNYIFKETLAQDPIIDRYEWNGQDMYAMVVPDEVGRTANYTLALPNSTSVRVYTPTAGATEMSWTDLPVVGGSVTISVGETPIFVVPDGGNNARIAVNETVVEELQRPQVTVFPNPTTRGKVRIQIDNPGGGDVVIRLFNAGMGTLHYETLLKQPGEKIVHPVDLSAIPSGNLIVDIHQKNGRILKKLININP